MSRSTSSKRHLPEVNSNFSKSKTVKVNRFQEIVSRHEFESVLVVARLKRDKMRAITAMARLRTMLAEIDMVIVENEFNMELERIAKTKKIKSTDSSRSKNNFRHSTPIPQISKSSKNNESNDFNKNTSNCKLKKPLKSNETKIVITEGKNYLQSKSTKGYKSEKHKEDKYKTSEKRKRKQIDVEESIVQLDKELKDILLQTKTKHSIDLANLKTREDDVIHRQNLEKGSISEELEKNLNIIFKGIVDSKETAEKIDKGQDKDSSVTTLYLQDLLI